MPTMDPYKNKARKARLRLIGAAVVAAAAVIAGGVLAVTSLGGDKAGPSHGEKQGQGPTPSSSGTAGPAKKYTPATAPQTHILKPRTTKNGISVGFEHSGLGALSAAVTYWQDLDILDDRIARRQWTTIASKDSPGTVDRAVSDVRKVREGANLPPSGGTPAGLSITTHVKAALSRSLDSTGDIVRVWMFYDRYATVPDKAGDDNPDKDETADLVVKWEDGDWKVTEESRYFKRTRGVHAYDPDSPYAFQDGWREVAGD